jgi:hypothetical protein
MSNPPGLFKMRTVFCSESFPNEISPMELMEVFANLCIDMVDARAPAPVEKVVIRRVDADASGFSTLRIEITTEPLTEGAAPMTETVWKPSHN